MTEEQTTPSRSDAWGQPLHDRLAKIMNVGIEEGAFPGGVILVRHRKEVVLHEAYGHSVTHRDAHTISPEQIVTRPGTIYDLASITKLFTATRVMQLVEEDQVQLDEEVATYLPEFAIHGKADITVRQLLAHVAGLPNLRLWGEATVPESQKHDLMAVTTEFKPGTAFQYSDTNFIVLGKLIEGLDGCSLDRAIRAHILGPLGLRQTGYGSLNAASVDVAPTEDESYVGRGMLRGEVHDENAWSLGGVAGHAGLFGTAQDISIFGQSFINGGIGDGMELLKLETVTEMTRNQVGQLGSRGLGWELNASSYMGGIASLQSFGHTGFTGTSIVIDPRRALVLVLLTNRVHPTRHGPNVEPTRRAVADAVLTAANAA